MGRGWDRPDIPSSRPVRRCREEPLSLEGGTAMVERQSSPGSDPRHHTTRIKAMLDHVIDHARQDVDKLADPKAQACSRPPPRCSRGWWGSYEHFEQKS